MAIPATSLRKGVAREPYRQFGWVALRVTVGFLLVLVIAEGIVYLMLPNVGPGQAIGDRAVYLAAARDWMEGGSFYPASQLVGPYVVLGTEILYPPIVLPLLVASTFLPEVLWWVIPIAITLTVLVYWRPSLIGWCLILACMADPFSFNIYAWGNPGMWFVAFAALGTVYHWPSVLILIKPTLFPFALVGIRHRSWWIALAALAVVSVAFLPMWFDYLTVTLNARGPLVSPLYSLPQFPLMLIPVIARWATTRGRPARAPAETEPMVNDALVAHRLPARLAPPRLRWLESRLGPRYLPGRHVVRSEAIHSDPASQ